MRFKVSSNPNPADSFSLSCHGMTFTEAVEEGKTLILTPGLLSLSQVDVGLWFPSDVFPFPWAQTLLMRRSRAQTHPRVALSAQVRHLCPLCNCFARKGSRFHCLQ